MDDESAEAHPRLLKEPPTIEQSDLREYRPLLGKFVVMTERETEVFMMLAEGRSAVRIAEELYLSKGTVNIHVQHIYKKLDIHSRQELLDIVSLPDESQASRRAFSVD